MKSSIFKSLMGFVRKHENGILTVATGVSTVYAVYRAIKDGPKILEKIDELSKCDDMTGVEKVKELGKVAGPTVAATGASLAFTCLHHKFTGDAISNLTSMISVAQFAMNDRKAAEEEAFGEGASAKIDETVAVKHAAAVPVWNDRTIINTGHGYDLFFDDWSGRWFYSEINFIKTKVNELNHQLLNDMYISVNEYYSALDLPKAGCGADFGWNVDYGMIDPEPFAQLDDNDRAYTVIKFRNDPCARWDSRRRW